VKGEIAFPVTADLTADAPLQRIVRKDFPGTRCAGCHFDEAASGAGFASRALRPRSGDDVSLTNLMLQVDGCAASQTARCKVLRAVLGSGDSLPQAFPADMPTLF
jgi:hypothetical protein